MFHPMEGNEPMAGTTKPAGSDAGTTPATTPATAPDDSKAPSTGPVDHLGTPTPASTDPEPMHRQVVDGSDPTQWTGPGEPPEAAYMPNVSPEQARAVREEIDKLEGVKRSDRDEAVRRGLARGARVDERKAADEAKARKAAAGQQETSAAPRVTGPAGSDPAVTTPEQRTS